MNMATTLAHVFEHDEKWYFYDTVTSQIYECDEVVAALIPHLDQINQGPLRIGLDQRWGKERVAEALREIGDLRQETGALKPLDLEILELSEKRYNPAKYENEIRQLQLSVSEQCNLRCEYCPFTRGRPGSRLHHDVYMTLETASAALDFFMARCADVDNPAISFYGGEPLLNFPVVKAVVEKARAMPGGDRLEFHLDTNGLAIDESIAGWLVANGINVQISLDGPASVHDRYRKTLNGHGSHAQVIAGLERLLEVSPEAHSSISFNAVLAPPYTAIADVIEYFSDFPPYRKFGVQAFPQASLDFADLSFMDFPQSLDPAERSLTSEEALAPIEERYLAECAAGRHDDLPPVLRSMFDHDLIGYHHRGRKPLASGEFFPTGTCQPGQRKLHVRADGSLLPCERGSDLMYIGHVTTGIDLQAVENLYHELVGSVAARCRTCWAVRRCSMCFIQMSVNWGPDGARKVPITEEFCANVRLNAEGEFRYYLSLEKSGSQALAWLQNTKVG